MKNTIVFCVAACAFALTGRALTVADVSAHARYPWQSVIDVDFTVSDSKASDLFKVGVSATCDGGKKKLFARTFLSEPLCGYGRSRVSWDIGADYPGLKVDDIQVAVTVAPVNPAAVDALDLYMVIDLSSGPNSPRYPVHYTLTPPVLVPTNDLVACAADPNRTTKLWLKRVKGSVFPFGGTGSNNGEGIFKAKMSPYYIGLMEVTQKQWALVMDAWPGAWSNKLYRAARPVESVNYGDVIGHNNWPDNMAIGENSFIGRMRARTGLSTLNLPTEAQWECVARAGNKESHYVSTGTGRYQTNQGVISDRGGDPGNGTAIVGSYSPNAWGFYDCYGNVMEMCLDAYASGDSLKSLYEGQDPVVDPIGPATHSTARYHSTRGGSFDNSSARCSSYDRQYCNSSITGTRDYRVGLRVAVSPEWKK